VGRDLYDVTADALLTDLPALLVGYRELLALAAG